MCSLRQSAQLTRLALPLCNDLLLKAISVYCRNLKELEITLSLDATEEGLLALAGLSVMKTDQGFHKHWDHALYIHKVGTHLHTSSHESSSVSCSKIQLNCGSISLQSPHSFHREAR